MLGVARFREHPSNLMDVRCIQLWGRFSQLGMWGQGVICEAEPRLYACRISPAAFTPRVSHAAVGLVCARCCEKAQEAMNCFLR